MISSGDRRGGWAKAAGALPGRARRSFAFFFFSQVPERRAPGQAEQPSPRACKASFGACRGPAALPPQARPGGAGVPPLPRREGPRRGLGVSKRREGPERAWAKSVPGCRGCVGGAPPTEPLRLFLFLEVFIRAPFLTWRRAAILLLPPAQGGR